MSEQKTVREWLETLPPGYRERAISQARPDILNLIACSIESAILKFQVWSKTKEGFNFWSAVDDAKTNADLPTLPVKPGDDQ